jgi:hypothetical protein
VANTTSAHLNVRFMPDEGFVDLDRTGGNEGVKVAAGHGFADTAQGTKRSSTAPQGRG